MNTKNELIKRSNNQCELCGATDKLEVFNVAPSDNSADQSLYLCETCRTQISNPQALDTDHWRCLNDAMWSEIPAVQVMSYRLLNALGEQDLVDMMYLEEATKTWADAETFKTASTSNSDAVVHKDSNGTVLVEGDTVTLIKDLDVKGAGFTAKRGTIVKNIHLTEDAKYIEGKINGTQIVLVAEYMKKSN